MRKLIMLFAAVAILYSCQNTGKQQKEEALNPKLAEFHEKTKEVFDKPSKPSEIAVLLELSGAPLMPELMNDPTIWEKYTTDQTTAAVNMGVYLADAIVLYAYDSIKLAYNSAIAGKGLSEVVGLDENVFMKTVIADRYKEEGGQSDSLFFVLDSALAQADQYLSADERFRLLGAMYVGNFIEKMYLVSNIIFNYPVDLPQESKVLVLREMMLTMSYYLDRLDYIIEIVEKASTEEDSGYLLEDLKALKKIQMENMLSAEQILTLTAADIFENEGMVGMHDQIMKIRSLIVGVEE